MTIPSPAFAFIHALFFLKKHISIMMSRAVAVSEINTGSENFPSCSCITQQSSNAVMAMSLLQQRHSQKQNANERKDYSLSQLSAGTALEEDANMGLLLPDWSTAQPVHWK